MEVSARPRINVVKVFRREYVMPSLFLRRRSRDCCPNMSGSNCSMRGGERPPMSSGYIGGKRTRNNVWEGTCDWKRLTWYKILSRALSVRLRREKEQILFPWNVLGAYFAELEALTKCADGGKTRSAPMLASLLRPGTNDAVGENPVD